MEWRYAFYAVYVEPPVVWVEEDRRGRLGTHLQGIAAPFYAYETKVRMVAQGKLVLAAIDSQGWKV